MAHPVEELKKIQREELNKFFDENENDLKPWGRKEWNERRDEVVGDECEWCDDIDGPFHVHHTDNGPNWTREWIKATDIAFVNSEEFDSSLVSGREDCPKCNLKDFYARKTKTPTYRCNNCEYEFSSTNKVSGAEAVASEDYDTKPYVEQGYYSEKAEWLASNRDAALEVFTDRFEDNMSEYIEMNNVITICQSCHYQHEQTSNQRCKKCGENWHNYKKPMCWDCLVEEKGLVECDCGNGWYQPDKYDACSDCR